LDEVRVGGADEPRRDRGEIELAIAEVAVERGGAAEALRLGLDAFAKGSYVLGEDGFGGGAQDPPAIDLGHALDGSLQPRIVVVAMNDHLFAGDESAVRPGV